MGYIVKKLYKKHKNLKIKFCYDFKFLSFKKMKH